MTDPREPFRTLDELEPPDIWQRAQRLGPKEPPPEPSPSGGRRVGVIALALVVTVATTGLLVHAFRAPPRIPPATPVPITPKANGKIAYLSDSWGFFSTSQVTIANGDGTDPILVDGSKGNLEDVRWSPDGSRLAYVDTNGEFGGAKIVLVSPEGDASTTLFETSGYIAGITWSPDGSTIAFGTSGDHSMFGAGVQFSDYHLETVSVAGGKTAPLGDITRATSPAWSPDGTTIAFVQDLNHLALMDVADGSSQIVATSTPASGPAWSPDGSWIAFVSEAVDGPTTIALIRPDGSQLRHIYTCQGGCLPLLSWSPDGASIAVTDFTNHSESVELLSPTTGDVRTMDLTGPRPAALDWQPIPADGSTASSAPLTSSGLVADGTLRCTVELPVNPLVPGQPTGASFTVTNVTDGAVQVWLGTNGYAGWLVFSADGLDLQDSGLTHAGIHGPPPDEQALAPGGSIAIGAMDTAVLWSGPLDVTPHCVDAALPAVQMEVMAPGAPASADAAIAQAVSSLSDAFVGCVPATSGAWVTGTFGTSDGTIDARCGAYVVERDGFDVVALVAVSPPDAPELDLAQLPDRIEAVPPPMFPQGSSVRVSWWVLVLTQDSTSCATHYAMSMGPDSYGGGGGICRAT